MAVKPLPPQDHLNKIFSYDPMTGVLTWRERQRDAFRTTRHWNAWNARFAGVPAGALGNMQMLAARLEGASYLVHRLIWKMVYGVDPIEVDHIDGCRTNNRLANLRNVAHAVNGRNQRRPVNNKSGASGVSWHKRSCKWYAFITINGKRRHLGAFASFDEAVSTRLAAAKELGFHANHGRANH